MLRKPGFFRKNYYTIKGVVARGILLVLLLRRDDGSIVEDESSGGYIGVFVTLT